MIKPYLLEQDGEGLTFTTTNGIAYFLVFREQQQFLFPSLPELLGSVFSFAFFPLIESDFKASFDERVMPTIIHAIKEKFHDKQNVVLFIVDDSDDRHDARGRLFQSLHSLAKETEIEMLRGDVLKGDISVMGALLVHTKHPYRNQLNEGFFTLLAKLSKE